MPAIPNIKILEQKFGIGDVTVLIATYRKPEVLTQCLNSLVPNAGIPLTLWIKDNDEDNIGVNAYSLMANQVKTKYFVTVDDDVIQFPKDWLKILLDAFTDVWSPHQYWGWLGIMPVRDKLTNGAIWSDYLKKTKLWQGKKYLFRIGMKIPQTCAMMHIDTFKKIGGFPVNLNKIMFRLDGTIGSRLEKQHLPMGLLEIPNIYHACGPYYNQLYEDVWKVKNDGQTIEEAKRQYQKKDKILKYDL